MSLDLSIYITIGNGAVVGLDDKNQLIFVDTNRNVVTDRVETGIRTKKGIEDLKEYLDRLAIHLE